MLLLPFEKIVYKTALTSDEIVHRLSAVVGPKRLFQIYSEKPYYGRFGDSMFEIERAIMGRNAFRPKIFGVIELSAEGTFIHVKMRPPISPLLLMSFWLFAIGAIAARPIKNIIFAHGEIEPETLIPIVMFSLGYGVMLGAFKVESIKSKKYFLRLFDADIVKN